MTRTACRDHDKDEIIATPLLSKVKVLDATPIIVSRYALTDEDILLAMIRRNRLIDLFTGTVCYSIQTHVRTSLRAIGHVETDEIYVGIDQRGKHFVFPIQARAGKDSIDANQVEQNVALCEAKLPTLPCRPIAAKLLEDDVIALFEFHLFDDEVSIKEEKHYLLVRDIDFGNEQTTKGLPQER